MGNSAGLGDSYNNYTDTFISKNQFTFDNIPNALIKKVILKNEKAIICNDIHELCDALNIGIDQKVCFFW